MKFPTLFLKEFIKLYSQKEIMLWSAFLTYLTVLNIVPLIYAFIFILSHIPFIQFKVNSVQDALSNIIPSYSDNIISYINLFLSKIGNLEKINLAILMVSSVSLILAFIKSVRKVCDIKSRTNILKIVIFVIVMMVFMVISTTLIFIVNVIFKFFLTASAYNLFTAAIPFIVWFSIIFSLFYIMLNVKIKILLISSFITAILVFALKEILAIYFQFFIYNKIYGSISIIPALLFWLFLFWNVILIGFMLTKLLSDRNCAA